jgi:hypothetical protein
LNFLHNLYSNKARKINLTTPTHAHDAWLCFDDAHDAVVIFLSHVILVWVVTAASPVCHEVAATVSS